MKILFSEKTGHFMKHTLTLIEFDKADLCDYGARMIQSIFPSSQCFQFVTLNIEFEQIGSRQRLTCDDVVKPLHHHFNYMVLMQVVNPCTFISHGQET